MKITQDKDSWEAGFKAGYERRGNRPGPEVKDSLAWHSGYIEGQAKALGYDEPEGASELPLP